MEVIYQFAWKEGDTILYVDASDRKYAMKNGNLAWRINNPGLIKHHCHSAKKNGSIGTFEKFAIFSNPLQGHQALEEWLRSKTMIQLDLFAIAKHCLPSSPEQFAKELAAFSKISSEIKLKDLTELEFKRLLAAIEKMCGYEQIGDEEFYLLPKIAAKIECIDREDLYLIGTDITLTQEEAINWISSHRLDAVVVRYSNGTTHLRSRPRYHMQTLKLTWDQHCETAGELNVLARMIGQKSTGQCTWGFINGIRNKREEAIESSDLISKKAGNELVAFGDAIKDLDCLDRHVLERYTQERCKFYRNEFDKISNVTVIDSGSMWEHSFKNESYQKIVETTIKKYRENKTKTDMVRCQELLMESFV